MSGPESKNTATHITENKPGRPKVSAVIPCLNEEQTLGICIKKAFEAMFRLGIKGEVVVGDNGSTDRSVEIAERLGARVVHQPLRGYGAALMAGIDAAEGEFIIMGDADDSYDWLDIAPFIAALDDGADIVLGNRFAGGIMPGAMPFLHRYVGNPVLSRLSRWVYKAPVGDFHCGMRAFKKEAYKKISLHTPGMEFATEMVVNAVRSGLTIKEVPIKLYPDKRSRPPHLRTFRDGWRHLRFIMMRAPNYLYMIPGGTLFIAGIALQLMLVKGPVTIHGFYFGIHFLALGCLMAMVGFNVINLGIFAKAIVASQLPYFRDSVIDWMLDHFTLEVGLLSGGAMCFAGLLINASILWKWVSLSTPMVDSIHIVFVATSAIAIGLNIVFSSFLINMFLIEEREWRSD